MQPGCFNDKTHAMKVLIALSILVLVPSCMFSQKAMEFKEVTISPNSEIYIDGSTNVNTFRCWFDIKLISGERQIRYIKNDDARIKFKNLALQLSVEGFDCGNKKMNSDFQELLQSDKDGDIDIQLQEIEFYTEDYLKAYVQINITEKTRNYSFPVQIKDGCYLGKLKLDITDFGLKPPTKAFGLIQVDEDIIINFRLRIEH